MVNRDLQAFARGGQPFLGPFVVTTCQALQLGQGIAQAVTVTHQLVGQLGCFFQPLKRCGQVVGVLQVLQRGLDHLQVDQLAQCRMAHNFAGELLEQCQRQA
ncbi:hypothetical protein D3C80_1972910 [compost metagenome]